MIVCVIVYDCSHFVDHTRFDVEKPYKELNAIKDLDLTKREEERVLRITNGRG